MGLLKLVVLGLVAFFAWKIVRSWQATAALREPHRRPPEAFEAMGECVRCGVHVPRSSLSPAGRCGGCESRASS